jgi:hypothetical protein
VRNFANDLPERLRTDYLLFAGQVPNQGNTTSLSNGHDESNTPKPIRQRRKSLTALPDSLQTTTTDEIRTKLSRKQLLALHQCMPNMIYYETGVANIDKPTFTRITTKNTYIRSLFNQLNENERLKYILKSIEKWNEFLHLNPNIIEHQIPTLHLLLSRNEDIVLYFSSIGLPQRPPINSYLLFNLEKHESNSSSSWLDLSPTQRQEYSQQLIELKTEYYQDLVQFVEQTLSTDYMKYEFFRNIKYAVKDYEIATDCEILDKNTGRLNLNGFSSKKIGMNNDLNQFNQIKEKLLATQLTSVQKNLVEELTQLLYKYVE